MINQSYTKSREIVMAMATAISTKDGMRYEYMVRGTWLDHISFPLDIVLVYLMQHIRKHGHPSSTICFVFDTHIAL